MPHNLLKIQREQHVLKHVDRIIIMPKDGIETIVTLIKSAKKSIAIKMFLFDSLTLLSALIAASIGGVAVRVMLNPHRSLGNRANDATMTALKAAGIAVRWTSSRFQITHEKSMVIDERLALLSTFNFVDKYFTETRDYGVLLSQLTTVQQILDCFEADWAESAYSLPQNSSLLLGCCNARKVIANFIDGVQHKLCIQHPKFSDLTIVDRILAAKARGVKVYLICGGRHGLNLNDQLDTFSALRTLERVGIPLRQQHGLHLHAKLLLADNKYALIGSMNIDRSAFDSRRELGVTLDDKHAIKKLCRRFSKDWNKSHRFSPSDPILSGSSTTITPIMDSREQDLAHE